MDALSISFAFSSFSPFFFVKVAFVQIWNQVVNDLNGIAATPGQFKPF